LGSNGGETIRIGTSDVCGNSSASLIEGNYFERCNGEGEIISNKSADNSFINNTFYECEGSLTLRHGNRATVSGNWFLGNNKKNTGGVRIINEGHRIYNNFFYQLRGKEYRSALSIMNGIPNSPPTGYAPVKNVIVANNTFVDCTLPWNFCAGAKEGNRTIKPESTFLVNNLVYCPDESELYVSSDHRDGIMLDNNLLIYKNGLCKELGSVTGAVQKRRLGEMDIVYTTIAAKKMSYISNDIPDRNRNNAVIGAFQDTGDDPLIELASSINCGPSWYKPSKSQEN
jgi:poly(beta-D-mannuronate) lyase